jgi:RNA polymerase sigma factor (sigma-70 family)
MNRLAVTKWDDDPGAAEATCHKCGGRFRVVAVRDGVRCGRDRCPHCRETRRIPDELHPLYLQWFGVVKGLTRQAVAAGLPEDVAETVCHTAYVEALLRWVPGRAKFNTLAYSRISSAVNEELRRRGRRPATFLAADHCHDDGQGSDSHSGGHYAATAMEKLGAVSPDDGAEAAAASAAEQIAVLLPRLTPRQRHVVAACFGVGRDRATLAEIGRELGVTKQRVSQIRSRALARLRVFSQQTAQRSP